MEDYKMTDVMLTRLLADYRDKNRALIERFKTFLHYWDGFKKDVYFEEKDITKRGFFNDEQLSNIKDALDIKQPRVKEIVDQLLKSLEEEKSTLDKFFKSNEHSEVVITTEFENLMINYTHTQYDLMQTFNELIPGVLEKFENMVGQKEIKIADSQQDFVKLYLDVEKALASGHKNLEVLFNALYRCLEELSRFGGHKSELINGTINSSTPNSKKFFGNYFTLNGHKIIWKQFNSAWSKAGLDKDDTMYADVKDNDDKKTKTDFNKYMKGLLEELFNEIEIEAEKDGRTEQKKAKDLIKDLIKLPSNFKTLKQDFKEWEKKLIRKINSNYTLERGRSLDDFIILGINELGNNTTFKKFKKDFLKEDKKDIIELVLDYMEELDKAKKDKKPYSSFIDENNINIKNYKTKDNDNDDDKNGEKLFNRIKSILYTIGTKFNLGTYGEIPDSIKTIEDVIYSEIKDSLKDLVKYTLGKSKSDIAENSGQYKCNNLTNILNFIDEDILKDKKARINTFLEFSKNNFQKLQDCNEKEIISKFINNLIEIIGEHNLQ